MEYRISSRIFWRSSSIMPNTGEAADEQSTIFCSNTQRLENSSNRAVKITVYRLCFWSTQLISYAMP